MRPPRKLYSATDAAGMLGCGEKQLRWLVTTGRLVPVILSRRRMFTEADIDRLIQESRSPCPQSIAAPAARFGGSMSLSTVVGFDAARKQRIARRRNESRRS
jgi:hypothetical protein